MGKGKAHVGKMGASLADSHIDTRIERRNMMKVVPTLEYAGQLCEGKAESVKQIETVPMTEAKKVLQ